MIFLHYRFDIDYFAHVSFGFLCLTLLYFLTLFCLTFSSRKQNLISKTFSTKFNKATALLFDTIWLIKSNFFAKK